MKRMLLLGILVIGELSYGRDYEYRENSELQVVENVYHKDQETLSKVKGQSEKNIDLYSEFHKEMDKIYKGNGNKRSK